ncbi:MAG: glutamate 5-kinase [Lachnospiraceae bacterium]|nr:glutamate 5-kinase [Lachnospiraceae bacterium]
MDNIRQKLKDKKRIVIKLGTSTIVHPETGDINYIKLEKLVRFVCDLKNQDKEVVLVSSGAIGVGVNAIGLSKKPKTTSLRQACAAIGQGQLMMVYQKLFSEYHKTSAQVLLTFDVITNPVRRQNSINTFNELLQLDVIPIVNENDTVATEEIEFGDNDVMSAIVASLIKADLVVLLSDIEGLFTDDPRTNPDAKKIDTVDEITPELMSMGKGSGTNYGTGGMASKLVAATIACDSGADMAIINGATIDNLISLFDGEVIGTVFRAHKQKDFDLITYLRDKTYLNV